MATVARGRDDRVMTQHPTPSAPPAVPRSGLDAMFDWFRGLGVARDTDNRWFGGVCSGLARRLGVDPILIRAAAILLALFGGFGVTVYIAAWLLLPDASGRILGEAALRDGDAWGVVLVVVLALLLVSGLAAAHNGPWWFAWWLVPLAVIGWIVLRNQDHRNATLPPTAPGGAPMPTPYAAPPTSATPPPYGGPPTGSPTAYAAPYGAPAPGASRYAGSWTPPRPMAPVAPAPRRRRAGGSAALVAVGLALAGYGLGYLLDGPIGFPGSPEFLGMVIALAALSLLTLALGLSGRRGGLAAVLVIVIGLATWAATITPTTIRSGAGIGDRTWIPVATSGQSTYELGIGDAVLDLSSLAVTTPAGGTPEMSAQVGVGNLRIRVPSGITARVTYSVGLGSVHHTDAGGGSVAVGQGSGAGRSGGVTVGSGPVMVDVNAHVGVGDIVIEEM